MRKLIAVIVLALVFCGAAEAKRKPTTQQKVKQTIYKYFHPLGQYRNALCIASHESNFKPKAFNGYDYGLFQIEWVAHKYFNQGRLFEIGYNVAAARKIYLDAQRRYGNGWQPWSTRHSCGY